MPSLSTTHLPIRRIYDIRSNGIIETIKFNDKESDFSHHSRYTGDNKVKVDVKIAALAYPTDFYHQLHNVIPSKRIIVKKHNHRSSTGSTKRTKYLVYPYSTCQEENIHHGSQCCCTLTYGEDLDGGLQESLYIPESLLIPIPKNVSLHDVCFIWDIILPFYIYSSCITNNTCIILNDVKREINEVLIILNHLNIDQSSVTIVDEATISSNYANKFDTVFCFNSKLGQFAEFCCQMQSVLQDKQAPKILTNFPIVAKSNNKTYQYMKLGFDDRKSCIELLQILHDLNTTRNSFSGSDDSPSQPRSNSTSTTMSSTSTYTSDVSSRQENQGDSQSIGTSSNSSQDKNSKSHCSWFWSDDDVDLTNYSDLSFNMDQGFDDDEDTCYDDDDDGLIESAAVHDMNKYIIDGKLRRVCYFNRSIKPNVNVSII
ncbi:hypothetical protein I9W82_000965 [Candida metapsilosis]|uniref:Uncharacterized protein n=1 Tax=Candida metapsilosis TaxID=273372 RepID=A0A8H7ZGZ2_9ASCO|nr:hypothetical protein I9W82_000965 [Candida metapsilosis]